VIGGVNGDTTVRAIQLRLRASGENHVSDARLVARDASGLNPITVVNMSTHVANGATGARVLIATSNLTAFTNPPLSPDFIIANQIPASYMAAGTLTYQSDTGTVLWRLSYQIRSP